MKKDKLEREISRRELLEITRKYGAKAASTMAARAFDGNP